MRAAGHVMHSAYRDQTVMKKIATAVALVLSATPAFASTGEFITPLPFAPNKQAFLEFMSKADYEKAGRVEFFEANGCEKPRDLTGLTPGAPTRLNENAYRCKNAYYRIASPLGTEVCAVKGLYWQGARRWKGKIYPIRSGFRLDQCRFKD